MHVGLISLIFSFIDESTTAYVLSTALNKPSHLHTDMKHGTLITQHSFTKKQTTFKYTYI